MNKVACFILVVITVTANAQQVKYTNGNNEWDADSLGNQRAIVSFNGSGTVAKTIIEWRRRDAAPWNKRMIVADARTRQQVLNTETGIVNNEKAELWFEPVSGKGDYYVYYLSSKNEGRSNYPKGVYLPPAATADEQWLHHVDHSMAVNATVKEIQSIDSFNSFYPMEIIATVKETAAFISKSNRGDYLVFTEDRMHPVKMTDYLPYHWLQQQSTQPHFSGETARGEYYMYQLGIYALQQLQDVTVKFSDLKDAAGNTISTKNNSCINTSGVDYKGIPFAKTVNVERNKVQALWCGIDVPENTAAGIYKGTVVISAQNAAPAQVTVSLTVTDKALKDGGVNEPWKQTRLKWLNSVLAQDNAVVAPYTPLQLESNTISLLGRKVVLNNDGFPKQVQTFFTEEMTGYKNEPNNILAAPVQFLLIGDDGKALQWHNNGLQYVMQTPGTIQWKAANSNDMLQMDVQASLEFDGFIAYTVKFTALQETVLKDIAMNIPFNPESADYLMGLGQKGGERPGNVEWKWDVANKNQDGAWIGSVNAGLQYSLRDEQYTRPLNTNFYLQKPLLLPASWGNANKGGISIAEKDNKVIVNNYSGERRMKKGDTLFYNLTLLITPFHKLDTDFQWATRFYHKYDKLEDIKAAGATVVNIHHATPINPWINYPFIEYGKMKAYIDSAHRLGLKVKIYNTVRELSNRAYETFPLRSLGHEIYSPGKGGGFSWLQEHLGDDYIAAWFVPGIKDAAIVNSGMSRWHNYYVEGMNWLVKNVGIDGIYLDDVAFDRITMKRIKRVLTQDGHPGIIDLHSANQYNKSDGFNNSANLYMEHFPYLNRLWFGEYFDYNNSKPGFFLTEISGIPFGLMGEMLQDGGNAWRGMVYGMTNRMPWSDNADPRAIWKAWDHFGMQGTNMIGYWSSNCPVRTTSNNVLATVYKKEHTALVAIASWAGSDTTIQLQVDWNKLGINPATAVISAPAISNLQAAATFHADDIIPVEKNKGWLLIVKEQ